MLITIADVLASAELADIRATLAAAPFVDGRNTAGWSAKLVKDNKQLQESSATLRILRERVERAIRDNPVFQAAVRPRAITPMLFSRYAPGQSYGSHIDNPIMDDIRTDVSFTLFLSDPDSYEGGELILETSAGEDAIKLDAGHMVTYPSTMLHRVEAVSTGERLAAVGWARSWVRDSAQREILFDLEAAKRSSFESQGKTPAFDLIAKASANLMRMWAD